MNPFHKIHVAIDLETLSTQQDATIISIGAVARAEGQPLDDCTKFYAACSTASQADRHVSPSTLKWWEDQSENARESLLFARSDDCPTLEDGLNRLTEWLRKLGEQGEVFVWGNGAIFDIGILEHAYTRHSPFIPWNFRKTRDMRTLYDITSRFQLDCSVERVGTHHNALDDADYQSRIIMRSLELLGTKQ